MGEYVRRVKTGSGATAVQIASKTRGVRSIVEHIGLFAFEGVGRSG
jgi:hypothetical protein